MKNVPNHQPDKDFLVISTTSPRNGDSGSMKIYENHSPFTNLSCWMGSFRDSCPVAPIQQLFRNHSEFLQRGRSMFFAEQNQQTNRYVRCKWQIVMEIST